MNYYEILGINENASQADIKQAYRRLTLKTHPDKNINGNDTEFKKLTEAFDTLYDINKRSKYDAFNIKTKYGLSSQTKSLIKVNNIIDEEIVNSKENNEIYDRLSSRLKSNYVEPIRKILEITIEESFNGCSSPLNIERKIANSIENELIYINIPAGTDTGEIIELKGKGNIDCNGNIGDIRVSIIVKPTDKYIRNKLDVIMNVNITLLQSLCGFSIDIQHLDGKTYRINSAEGNVVAPNSKRIIPKKGFIRGDMIGNLIILFNVIYPQKIKLENIKKLIEIFENN